MVILLNPDGTYREIIFSNICSKQSDHRIKIECNAEQKLERRKLKLKLGQEQAKIRKKQKRKRGKPKKKQLLLKNRKERGRHGVS